MVMPCAHMLCLGHCTLLRMHMMWCCLPNRASSALTDQLIRCFALTRWLSLPPRSGPPTQI